MAATLIADIKFHDIATSRPDRNIIFVTKRMFMGSRNPIKYIWATFFFIGENQNGCHLSAEKQQNSQMFNDSTSQ